MNAPARRGWTVFQGVAVAAALVTGQTFNLFNLPALSTHRDVKIQVEIQAPPEVVWNLLTDLPGYTRWNPYIYPAQGRIAEGQVLDLEVHATSQTGQIEVKVLSVTPGRVMSWGGNVLGVSRTLTFTIDDLGSGRSRVTAEELFNGVLLPFVGGVPDQAREGLTEMLGALRSAAEVESPGVSAAPTPKP